MKTSETDPKIKALIIDDEERSRDVLHTLLSKHAKTIEVLDECDCVEEAVQSIKTHQPDVIFLDIEMPRYAGFEIVEFFENIDFEIIFITAYDQYAIKAFELAAIDYLLKPIEIKRLKAAIDKLQKKIGTQKIEQNYKILVESLKNEKTEKIIIPFNREQKVLYFKDIIAIEAQESYSVFHCSEGQKFMVSKNLKYYESILEDSQFFRSHKSWLINTDKITSYSKKNLEIELANFLTAKLSKYKKSDFEDKHFK